MIICSSVALAMASSIFIPSARNVCLFPLSCAGTTVKNFSSSRCVSASIKNIFRRKSQNDTAADPTQTERRDMKSEVMKDKRLGAYDKAALSAIVDKGLGKTVIPYEPPADAEEKLRRVFQSVFGTEISGTDQWTTTFPNLQMKFQFLTECEKTSQYAIPNSMLHQLTNVGEVMKFYLTPVSGTNGLTQFQVMPDLPKNMHVTYEPYIFHPDTDPYFGGIPAFTHQTSYIKGNLKTQKIYKDKGYKAPMDWPKALDLRPRFRSPWPNPYIERDKYE